MATTNLTLVSPDITTGWTATGGDTTHYTEIDEGTAAPSDADYTFTTTINATDEFTLLDTPANTSEVTQIDVNIRGYIDDGSSTARFEVSLWHTGGASQVGANKYLTGTELGGYGTTPTTASALSWTTLTLTKTQADSLQLRVKFLET